MKIKIEKNNYKHWLALPLGLIAYVCVLIACLITNRDVEVSRKHD